MTQRSRMAMGTTENRKKLKRSRQITGKTKDTRVKKIWLKVLGKKGSRKPRDSSKENEGRKRKDGRKQKEKARGKDSRR
jgi:hypothetical protein